MKIHSFFKLLSLSLIILSCNTNPSESVIQRKQLFDYDWKFYLGDAPQARQNEFNDSDWRTLDLPHDWSIEGTIEKENPTGNDGGYFPAGIGWYRKTFEVPQNYDGQQVSIYFEGVYMNAEVYLNGELLGKHPYGYTSFYYDLTPYLQVGKSNTIAVNVDNSEQKNCRWYSGSGIYRHVWLMVKNPIHIQQWGIVVTTPEVTKEEAKIQVKTTLQNSTNKEQNCTVNARLFYKGKSIAEAQLSDVKIGEKDSLVILQKFQVNHPELWSPEHPELYTAKISIHQKDVVVDEENTQFGIRSLKFSAKNGFELNGQKLLLNGGCVHHDNGCLGAAAYDRAEERKVELLKKAGFNAVRTAHNPPSEAFLNACDRLGLLVIDEAFDGWRTSKTPHDYSTVFDEWSQRDVQAMVKRDVNHPSIIMWSIGNEIIERKSPEAVKTAKMLAGFVKAIDTTRAVTSAMTTWDKDWEIFDPLMAEHDVCGYNYTLHYAESDHERAPERIIVQTESYPRDAFFCWNMVQNHSYIIGDFVWTAMDYLGESGIGRYYYPGEPDGQHWEKDFFPWHGAYCGDIDLTGWRKPISHYRDMLYNGEEKIYMAVKEPNPKTGQIKETMWSVWPTWESWNWPGYEGKKLEVEVYSKYPRVQLFLNDQFVAEKPTGLKEEFKATFQVPYEAGTLKAVGIEDETEAKSCSISTTGKPEFIRLVPDRTTIAADGQDLSFVIVEITDADGNLVPNANFLLQFKVDGQGAIAGVDNASLKDPQSYLGNSRKTWNGRALVVLKSTRKTGQIKLSATAENLASATCTIDVK